MREESVHRMSLDSFNVSVSSVNFEPMHESSPAPRQTLGKLIAQVRLVVKLAMSWLI